MSAVTSTRPEWMSQVRGTGRHLRTRATRYRCPFCAIHPAGGPS